MQKNPGSPGCGAVVAIFKQLFLQEVVLLDYAE